MKQRMWLLAIFSNRDVFRGSSKIVLVEIIVFRVDQELGRLSLITYKSTIFLSMHLKYYLHATHETCCGTTYRKLWHFLDTFPGLKALKEPVVCSGCNGSKWQSLDWVLGTASKCSAVFPPSLGLASGYYMDFCFWKLYFHCEQPFSSVFTTLGRSLSPPPQPPPPTPVSTPYTCPAFTPPWFFFSRTTIRTGGEIWVSIKLICRL